MGTMNLAMGLWVTPEMTRFWQQTHLGFDMMELMMLEPCILMSSLLRIIMKYWNSLDSSAEMQMLRG